MKPGMKKIKKSASVPWVSNSFSMRPPRLVLWSIVEDARIHGAQGSRNKERLESSRSPAPFPPRLLHFLNQHRHNSEQVPHNRIIRNLKNRRLGIFVDCDYISRALHADNMLDRSRNSERQV